MRNSVQVLIVALNGAAGYFSATAFPIATLRTSASVAQNSVSALPGPGTITGVLKDSALVAEWEQLRATHGASPEDLPALYDVIKKLEDPFRRRAFRAAALADWAANDPQAALRYLREKDKYSIPQFLREWLRRDPEGAVTGMLADPQRSYETISNLLAEIARVAPGRVAEICAQMPKSENRWESGPKDAFALFAEHDLEAARAAAEALSGPWRAQAISGVAKAWAEKDGSAALTWAQALPAGTVRDDALKAALTGWAKSNPIAALAHLDLAPPGGEEMYYASDTGAQVLREAAKKDWNATMDWLRENPGKIGRASLDGLQEAFTKRLNADPAGMMRAVTDGATPWLRDVFSNSILNDGYTQRDAIWAWLEAQPSTEQMRGLRLSLVNAMAWREPQAALDFMSKVPATAENQPFLDQAAQTLVNGRSYSGHLAELLETAPAAMRPALLAYGLMNGGESFGGDDAPRWAARVDALPQGKRDIALTGLARGWAASDPDAAVKWALGLSDSREREQAFGTVASTWAVVDEAETVRFLQSMPKGADRDAGTLHYVVSLARTRPEEAWNWALEIQDPQRRTTALMTPYQELRKRNPETAEQLLNAAPLSPAEANEFRKSVTLQNGGMKPPPTSVR